MTNFESGLCSPLEYSLHKNNRIFESDLVIQGMYTVMFDLGDRTPTGAAKFPAKVTEVKEPASNTGIIPVHFTILNVHVADVATRAFFKDGFANVFPDNVNVADKPVQEGYFMEYGASDDVDQQLQDIISRHTALVLA